MSDPNVEVVMKREMLIVTAGQKRALKFLVEYAQEQHSNNGVLQMNISEKMLDKLEDLLEEKGK